MSDGGKDGKVSKAKLLRALAAKAKNSFEMIAATREKEREEGGRGKGKGKGKGGGEEKKPKKKKKRTAGDIGVGEGKKRRWKTATSTTVVIGNIPWDAKKENIEALVLDLGRVHQVRMVKDKESKNFKGVAIVQFATEESARAALAKNGVLKYRANMLRVERAAARTSVSRAELLKAYDARTGEIDQSLLPRYMRRALKRGEVEIEELVDQLRIRKGKGKGGEKDRGEEEGGEEGGDGEGDLLASLLANPNRRTYSDDEDSAYSS